MEEVVLHKCDPLPTLLPSSLDEQIPCPLKRRKKANAAVSKARGVRVSQGDNLTSSSISRKATLLASVILLNASVSFVNTLKVRPTELEPEEHPEAPEKQGRDIRTCGVREPSGWETIGTRSGKPSRSMSPIRRGKGKDGENVVSNSSRESELSANSEETSRLEKD